MLPALAVAEFHNMAEDVDHQIALLLFFVDLLRHQTHQLFLLGIEQGGVDDAAVDHQGVEGAADKVGSPQVIGPLHMGGGALGGDHDDRDVLNPVLPVHQREDLEAVHLWHHNVQEDQGNGRPIFLERLHGLHAVLRLQDFVLIPQHIRQDGAVHL